MVVGMESWHTRKWGIGEKSLRTFVLDGNLLTIQHLASLERPAHQKTNLTTLCKNLSDFWSILGRYHVYLWTSLCWKKVFMMRSPLLQQSCYKHLPFSFSPVTPCFPIKPFHVSVSVPTCALKFSTRTVDSVGDTWRRSSFILTTKAWYSLEAMAAYICNRHDDRSIILSFNMQTCDPKEIQFATQSDNQACEISTLALADKLLGSAPEYKSLHPPSKATFLSWKNTDTSDMIPLCFINQF